MTTITYKGGIIAADTGSYPGRMGEMTKIAKDGHFLAGACGDATYCAAFLKWFLNGRQERYYGANATSDRPAARTPHLAGSDRP